MSAPLATYRLQLHEGFPFDSAAEIAGYLRELGVSHVYCSPCLQAAAGSTHGYDVVDYQRVSEELGGEEARERFCAKLKQLGLGQVLDIVPNHMSIAAGNRWWWDTLENGASSRYAMYFDIEWNAPEERLRDKILLPMLGDQYGLVLKAKQIVLARDGGSFVFHYFEHAFPAAPESMAELLAQCARTTSSERLGFLAASFARLPQAEPGDWETVESRHRDKEVLRELLRALLDERADVADEIDSEIRIVNEDLHALDALLQKQNYRLARWRSAGQELAYRRFFDVNALIGVRMVDERIFADTHRLVLEWLRWGDLDGVRVDHPDGLRDPEQYFRWLRNAAPRDVWILAEKILQRNEQLPDSWSVAGTTGYDFLNLAGGLFIDPAGEAPLTDFVREITGDAKPFRDLAREKKLTVLSDLLGSDVNRLTALFLEICERNLDHRDYTRHELHEAIPEVIADLGIYRTYVRAREKSISDLDRRVIGQAVEHAIAARSDLDARLFLFLGDVLTLNVDGPAESDFVMRFQQISAAAMAKGVEDTAFYSDLRLVALNEVGGDPARFGVSIAEFHEWCRDAQAQTPLTMLATSTHDTKRSEDVRSRIGVLSEIPMAWGDAVRGWIRTNARYRSGDSPGAKAEYLLYQTLVGAWPISKDRLSEYMKKAAREAKEQTSWLAPNEEFEKAMITYVEGVLGDAKFIARLEQFLARVVPASRIYSLAQTLLKCTAPGVPDFYQGAELWTEDLVDPDNRRPVNYTIRKKLLCEVGRMRLDVDQIVARENEGLPKLWTIVKALEVRRERSESFGDRGSYTPLYATGDRADHVVAYQRGDDVIVAVPRLIANLDIRRSAGSENGWGETRLEFPAGGWTNQFTGESINGGSLRVATLFEHFPCGLLTRNSS
jgi:(1->4)-alpha-D-glucan 1-alpha-D-glucosylmutase